MYSGLALEAELELSAAYSVRGTLGAHGGLARCLAVLWPMLHPTLSSEHGGGGGILHLFDH